MSHKRGPWLGEKPKSTITIGELMKTPKAKRMYKIIAADFERGLELSPKVGKSVNAGPCYLGSQFWIEALVYKILRESAK